MKIQSIQSTNFCTNSKQVKFSGINVHIIDGGAHADNMKHFAEAIMKDIKRGVDIKVHYIDTNKVDVNTKQLDSLEDKLKSLNGVLHSGDYLAIPGLAPVGLLNLQDRIRDVLGKNIILTPQNLKSHKEVILKLLKELYEYKYYYSEQIQYMDKNDQKLSHIWGIIQEVNNLVKKGVNVYIPSGHGIDSAFKWKAKQDGFGDEMYRYIAKGIDTNNNDIKRIINEVKKANWYDFNLLALSDAHIVNVKKDNTHDALFKAFDTFVNDGELGVYNFYPVRDYSGKILGYSYHDRSTVEYPFYEFPANDKLDNINKYVGLKVRDLYPSWQEIKKYREYVRRGRDTSSLPQRLYPIREIFDESMIHRRKLDILGHLIDRTQQLRFDSNNDGEVLFQKANCEGSSRPSVLQMWGSCFSSINAIKRDILKHSENYSGNRSVKDYVRQGDKDKQKGYYEGAEFYYNKAIDIIHPNRGTLTSNDAVIEIYTKLYDTLKSANKVNAAKGIGDILINLKSYAIKDKKTWNPFYKSAQTKIGQLYADMAKFCESQGERYPAKVCVWASEQLLKRSSYANKIVQRRATQNPYIGDLYNECH